MRKPQIGDTWKLNWFKHKPVKEIGTFISKWIRERGTAVPAVMFRHQPTVVCTCLYTENGDDMSLDVNCPVHGSHSG